MVLGSNLVAVTEEILFTQIKRGNVAKYINLVVDDEQPWKDNEDVIIFHVLFSINPSRPLHLIKLD